MNTEMLFLSRDDLNGLAEPAEFVDAVRDAYRQHGEGAPTQPRTTLTRDDPPGTFTGYLAILPESGRMGGYTYSSGFGDGDAWFLTPLFDSETGQPLALLDGVEMNPFKTGAVGATAVDALARSDGTDLGLIGSGAQAAGQLQAAVTVRKFTTVRVYSPTPDHRQSFAEEFDRRLSPDVIPVPTSSEAVRQADVVITATRSPKPVFNGDDLAPGTHVNAIGQYHPKKRELDTTTVVHSKYVPDLRARVHQDAGAFLLAQQEADLDEEHVHAELGEVVAERRPGRESREEITVFDSGGTALETVAGASLLYDRARARGHGTPLSLEPASQAQTGRW